MATIGCTVVQLLIPKNTTAAYIAPSIAVRSLAASLYHKIFWILKKISQQNDEGLSYFAHKINEIIQIIKETEDLLVPTFQKIVPMIRAAAKVKENLTRL